MAITIHINHNTKKHDILKVLEHINKEYEYNDVTKEELIDVCLTSFDTYDNLTKALDDLNVSYTIVEKADDDGAC